MAERPEPQEESISPAQAAWRRFRSDKLALASLPLVALLGLLALLAPLLANPRPLLLYTPETGLSLPFLRTFFAPESTEYLIEQCFNWLLLVLIAWGLLRPVFRKNARIRRIACALAAMLLLLPFALTRPKLERVNFRDRALPPGSFRVMAPLPCGPYEQLGTPGEAPSRRHLLGCDELGRDLACRIIYGARVSLAVGVFATFLALVIGLLVGISAGYIGRWYDLAVMRLVEVLMCFPVFLLLLILMAIFQDRKFEQSILIVIGVIAATGWIGIAQLARGESLKQREMAYIQAARTLGVSGFRIMAVHLLPNIAGVILITFTFGVAGAILAESGLSFLGFGVQPPTASWGGMLRAAFDDPLGYWHLTVFPGLMLFWAVAGFNFLGEGIRKALDPRA